MKPIEPHKIVTAGVVLVTGAGRAELLERATVREGLARQSMELARRWQHTPGFETEVLACVGNFKSLMRSARRLRQIAVTVAP